MKIKETEYIISKNEINYNEKKEYYNRVLKNLYNKYDNNIIDKEIGLLTLFYQYHDKQNTNLSTMFELITDKGIKHNIKLNDYLLLSNYVNFNLEINDMINKKN